jgi:hypothetical protein
VCSTCLTWKECRQIERNFVVLYLRFGPVTVRSNLLCNKYDFMGCNAVQFGRQTLNYGGSPRQPPLPRCTTLTAEASALFYVFNIFIKYYIVSV